MDMNKMKSKWRTVYNINALSTGEKINLYDIMHNGILRDRYISKYKPEHDEHNDE
jgi:hypothetical protein